MSWSAGSGYTRQSGPTTTSPTRASYYLELFAHLGRVAAVPVQPDPETTNIEFLRLLGVRSRRGQVTGFESAAALKARAWAFFDTFQHLSLSAESCCD
jgi:hypothetical protein